MRRDESATDLLDACGKVQAMQAIVVRMCGALMVMMASGCLSRVVLPAPPSSTAPEAERKRALSELAPAGQLDILTVYRGGAAYQSTAFLMLGSGLRVEDPRDLEPVVTPQSATAHYAAEFGDKQALANGLMSAGWIGVAAGVAFAVAGILTDMDASSTLSPDRSLATPGAPFLTAGLVIALVGAALAVPGIFVGHSARKARASAFLAYPNDLQRRLGFMEAAQTVQTAALGATPPPSGPGDAPVVGQEPGNGKRCVASELPEWKSASAREKQALMKQCAAPVASE